MTLHARTPLLDPGFQAWGDSLTAGITGMNNNSHLRWTALLGRMFRPPRTINNQGVGGESAAQIAARMTDYVPINTQIQLLWAGRNGVLSLSPASIVASIQTMVAAAASGRYLVFTVPYYTDGTEDPTDASGILVTALNNLIKSTWPNNYFDAAATLGYDDSLRYDGIHMLASGQALIASALYSRLRLETTWGF